MNYGWSGEALPYAASEDLRTNSSLSPISTPSSSDFGDCIERGLFNITPTPSVGDNISDNAEEGFDTTGIRGQTIVEAIF
jgi:hypothetical protein